MREKKEEFAWFNTKLVFGNRLMFILENILKSLNKKNSIPIKKFTKITHASGLYLLSRE